ncbi:MAG: dihydroneopterin aldolase [Proteobacteria bacterium]|jgi:7,8-dihydroneopterin aldolase/epimerase/oxygenase|nr:dihydroneopterin aldolase [Pseudomonadota bacterium]
MKTNNVITVFEKKISNDTVKKIVIKDLILKKIFGFYPNEKTKPQRLKFNIKLELVKNLKFNDQDLQTILDYDEIINIINNILDKKINFLETLADQIIEEIFQNSKITAIELKIEKLDILKNAVSAGIEINKRKG